MQYLSLEYWYPTGNVTRKLETISAGYQYFSTILAYGTKQ
jgi:hypothetical protein